jgi:hypothetical protein
LHGLHRRATEAPRPSGERKNTIIHRFGLLAGTKVPLDLTQIQSKVANGLKVQNAPLIQGAET